MKRTTKQMQERWDKDFNELRNLTERDIKLIPDFVIALWKRIQINLTEMRERGWDIGYRSENQYHIDRVRRLMMENEVLY